MNTTAFYVVLASFLLFAVGVTIAILWLVYKSVRWIAGRLPGIWPLFGKTPEARLWGLGIAVLFFHRTLGGALMQALDFVIQISVRVPANLQDVWRSTDNVCWFDNNKPNIAGDCISRLVFGLLSAPKGVIAAAQEAGLGAMEVGSLIRFLGTWIIASRLVTALYRQSVPSIQAPQPLPSRGAGDIPVASQQAWKRNIPLFATLLVGFFLMIASFAAIPMLEPGSATDAAEAAAFEQRISERVGREDVFEALYPAQLLTNTTPGIPARAPSPAPGSTAGADVLDAGFPDSGDAGGDASHAESSDQSPSTIIGPPTAADSVARQENGRDAPSDSEAVTLRLTNEDQASIRQRQWIQSFVQAGRDDLQSEWSGLRDWTRHEEKKRRNAALHKFKEMDANLKTVRQKLAYGGQLEKWYEDQIDTLHQNLNNCRASVKSKAQLYEQIVLLEEVNPVLAQRLGTGSDCYQAMLSDPPKLPTDENLGVFSFIAFWLVETDSLPLTLITGLLGCGLLGSVVSTFIKRKTLTTGAAEIVDQRGPSELISVIVRGVSAAVVVFLAAKGGLAIFAGGGSQPNAYVVLLSCLLAAVFSERVWKWAEDYVNAAKNDGNVPVGTPPAAEPQNGTSSSTTASAEPQKGTSPSTSDTVPAEAQKGTSSSTSDTVPAEAQKGTSSSTSDTAPAEPHKDVSRIAPTPSGAQQQTGTPASSPEVPPGAEPQKGT